MSAKEVGITGEARSEATSERLLVIQEGGISE
jgi:hypothetical protein